MKEVSTMQYGHFDDESREYVITRPDTPRSWSNYLGSTTYGAIITNNAGVTLVPGESREMMIVFGVGNAATIGKEVMGELDSVENGLAALEEVKQYWHARIGSFETSTPDAALDSMVNVWNAYNSLVTFAWSRSASLVYAGARDGLGYRDTVQDILGIRPDWSGLLIDPCIPSNWDGFRVMRRFRGATYDIRVENPSGAEKGLKELTVNGEAADPAAPVPAAVPGSRVSVEAVMGTYGEGQ